MKKALLLFAILFGISFLGFAQENFSIRAGYKTSIGSFRGSIHFMNGINLGLNRDFNLLENIRFRPGVYYYFQWRVDDKIGADLVEAYKSSYPDFDVKSTSRYRYCNNFLEIPLMLAFQKNGFDFEIGPYFSFLLASRTSFAGNKVDLGYDYKKFDIGVKIGFGYKFFDKYYLGIGYEHGIQDKSKHNYGSLDKTYTDNVSVNLGYRF